MSGEGGGYTCENAICLPGAPLVDAAEVKVSSTSGGWVGPLQDEDGCGGALTSIGDFDGDGVDDLAVGCSYSDDGGKNRGSVYLLMMTDRKSVV